MYSIYCYSFFPACSATGTNYGPITITTKGIFPNCLFGSVKLFPSKTFIIPVNHEAALIKG